MAFLDFRGAGAPPAFLLFAFGLMAQAIRSGYALSLARRPERSEGSLFAFEPWLCSAQISSRTSHAQTNSCTPRRNKRNTIPRASAPSHPARPRSPAYSPAHSPEHSRPHPRHRTESPNPIPPAAMHPPATNPPKSSTAQTPSSPVHTNRAKQFSPASLRAIPPAPPNAAGKSDNPSSAAAQQQPRHHRQTKICSPRLQPFLAPSSHSP